LLLSPAVVEATLRGAHGSLAPSHGKIHFTTETTKKRRLRRAA
jgi:hypothetical protein